MLECLEARYMLSVTGFDEIAASSIALAGQAGNSGSQFAPPSVGNFPGPGSFPGPGLGSGSGGFPGSGAGPGAGLGSGNSETVGQFGLVNGKVNRKLLTTDQRGVAVTFRLTGPGSGTVSRDPFTRELSVALTGVSGSTLAISGRGSIAINDIQVTGTLRSLQAQPVTLSGTLSAPAGISTLVLGSVDGGTLATGALGVITIRGNLVRARILSGANFGSDGHLGGGDDVYSGSNIQTLNVTGSVTDSLIAVGLNPGADGTFLTKDDILLQPSAIAKTVVNGNVDQVSEVVASQLPIKAKISHKTIDPATDARFRTSV